MTPGETQLATQGEITGMTPGDVTQASDEDDPAPGQAALAVAVDIPVPGDDDPALAERSASNTALCPERNKTERNGTQHYPPCPFSFSYEQKANRADNAYITSCRTLRPWYVWRGASRRPSANIGVSPFVGTVRWTNRTADRQRVGNLLGDVRDDGRLRVIRGRAG